MSRLSHSVKAAREDAAIKQDQTVTNYMGGQSYKLDPLQTLRIIASSSIFMEPSYYRPGKDARRSDEISRFDETNDPLIMLLSKSERSTTDIFTEAIDAALDFDFTGTLEFASQLRNLYNIRLNPQVIAVRAAIHPKRKEWTEKNPGMFEKYESEILSRADEPMTQLAYYIALNGGEKKGLPTILKKALAKKLGSLDSYAVNKYANGDMSMIDAVRLTHANSPVIDELMKEGRVAVADGQKTWEQLKSEGKSWHEILSTIKLGHMALLRNLNGIFTEIDDSERELTSQLLKQLKDGVLFGKQLPFRYYSAWKRINESETVKKKALILDALEECIDVAIQNMPHLSGKTVCLSDNSGSAWGAIPTEYGSVRIAEIDNLSSVITAMASDEGEVIKFGDKMVSYPIQKRQGALSQAAAISKGKYDDVGGGTEGGIWKFFKRAIDEKIHYDNIVIYSDQQAGTGGLYGVCDDLREYSKRGYCIDGHSINVYKLILDYRKLVNPKCNCYSVMTAGYDNMLFPQMAYRTALLSGWTGKECLYIDYYNKAWDDAEKKK